MKMLLRQRFPRIFSATRRAFVTFAALGAASGSKVLIFEALRRHVVLSVWCRPLGRRIWIRTCSMDIEVVNECLLKGIYACEIHPPVDTIIDGGAHIGCATLLFAGRHPDATIVAIEPDPTNFALLVRNTAGCKNVTALQVALSDSVGTAEFHDPGQGTWAYRFRRIASKEVESRTSIHTVSIVDIIERFQWREIDLLKLDIEGAEVDVLGHSDSWIKKVRVLIIELHDRFHPDCTKVFKIATKDFSLITRTGNVARAVRL